MPTIKALRETHGRFDDNLWSALLSDAHSRHQLREALTARYFPEHRDKLAAIAAEKPPALKEDALREEPPGRDGAFRHTILEIYDYRCAACGIRVKISDDFSLVEAAHIIPFGVSRNDKPDNGLALCPNHHWAMDRLLIAPCPGSETAALASGALAPASKPESKARRTWSRSRTSPSFAPSEEKFYPAIESLRWREKHLNAKY